MIELPHKIHIPQCPLELVSRPRLINALQTALQRKLITLVAPTGYGKTSLLIDLAHTVTAPVCWYTLDSYDADPWTFLSYLAASIEHRFPGTMTQTTQLLDSPGQLFRTATATLMRELSAIRASPVICLDDWHLVEDVAEIKELVTQLVLRCPNCHVILASRSHPALPNQMLLAARRQFVSIDETQLRFYADELAAVVAAEGIPNITVEQAQTLVDRSDGWVAGVLLTLQITDGDISSALSNSTAMSHPVRRFLAEQVLDKLPPELQLFLCETSMLEKLTAAQCDTLLGRSDSWSVLEHLVTRRLFISEIEPGVLRYHPLFREFLQQRLSVTWPARFRELGLTVAAEYGRQRNWSMAFDLCVRASDLTAAQQVLRAGGEDLYMQGRLETLERAFAILPTATLDVTLHCLKAKVVLDRGHHAEAQALIDQAQTQAEDSALAQITLLQAVLDRIGGRYEQARDRALQVLATSADTALQGAALRTLAISQQRLSQPLAAIETLQRAQALEQSRGTLAALAQVQHELMVCYHAVGDLRAAEEVGRCADAYWSTVGNLGRRALTRNSLALNQALTGRYQEALETAAAALRDAQDAATPQYEAAVLSTQGDIYADLALYEQAMGAYERALRVGGTTFIRSHIKVAQIGLLIQQGRYDVAARQLTVLPTAEAQPHTASILLQRAQIAAGRANYAAGLTLARQAIEYATANHALLSQLRGWVLTAWLHSQAHPSDEALILAALGQAAEAAEGLGHAASAAVASLRIRPLLQRIKATFPRAQEWLQQQDTLRAVAATLGAQSPVASGDTPVSPAPVAPVAEVSDQRPLLRALYLGGDQVWVAQQALPLGAGRPREVLAYMLTHPRGVSRAELYRAIWCEEEPLEGSNALNRVIYRLRAALPEGAVVTTNRDTYRLDRAVLRIEVDVEAFERALDSYGQESDPTRQAELLNTALDLYRGPFLGDQETAWGDSIRTRLERRYRQALRLTAESSERAADFQRALELFHQLTQLDVTNIAAHAGIMRCHVALNEPALAIAQYRWLTNALNDELGIELDLASEPEHIYQALIGA